VSAAGAGADSVSTGEDGAAPAAVAVASMVSVGGCCDFLLGWSGCRAGWGGSASRSACCFVSPSFPIRVLNSGEQGRLVGVGQTPAHCSDLCLHGIPSMAAQFFQIFQ